MDTQGFALFDTPVGACGVAWNGAGLIGIQLPERSASATRHRMGKRFPESTETKPPGHVQSAIDAMIALLRGKAADLSSISLDLTTVPSFQRRVYEEARRIGPGETVTYGELAERAGVPGSARAVGQALGRNPFPIVVPCHRVLAADGAMRGFSAPGGVDTKRRLLEIEGASIKEPRAGSKGRRAGSKGPGLRALLPGLS